MSSLTEQINQLEAAITAQEALRPVLGAAAVDAVIAAVRAQLESLRAQQPAATSPPAELLARLMPKELADKARATRRIEGERKQVTVIFADISGFTALGERLDPEVIRAFQNDLFAEMAGAVYEYEGFVEKFVGDAIMAVFGAPITHEDDPERALRAALVMRERTAQLNRRWADRIGQPLSLHVGVNTGTVVAGEIGSGLGGSYAVTGDTVNTTSRLQNAAQPDQILVSRETYRLTQAAFTFAALDPIVVKGKREPLPVFELQRAKLSPDKSRGLKGLGSTFVGRERELAQLRAVVSELEAGRGRIVSINGEAGIGKSRLMAEWRAEVGEQVRWAEGRAFAHTTSLAYGPFLDMFRRYARIQDDDTEADARARFEAAVAQLLPDHADARAVFANLLALHLTDEESALLATLPGEALRRRLFALIAALFERLAREQPTILVIEDIHWADLTSLELIESLLPLTERAPLALVGVRRLRPSEPPTKLRQAIEADYAHRFTDVALVPLSETSSLNMVEQLLSISAIPETLRALILRKAEGNPFFVEEVIRALIERGALMQTEAGWAATPLMESVTVPDSLQGLLMSRLDSLPEETKWVAQQASVIGRIFLYRVLQQMNERSANVDADLNHLEREELIRERVRLPEVEYIFKHALTQEVAYQSLLGPRRRELHRKVGAAMEEIFAERLGEFQSIIGEHCLRGEAWDKAADYLITAGDAAARLYAHAEARLHYARAIDALSRLPDTDDNRRRRVDTLVKWVSVSFAADSPEQNFARLAQAEEQLQRLPEADRLRAARVQRWKGTIHYYRNQAREAIGYFRQVLAVAQEFHDEELLALPSATIGRVMVALGDFGKAEQLIGQAIPLLEKTGQWQEWTLSTSYYGVALAAQGRYAEGLAESQKSLAHAQQTNNLIELAGYYGPLCVIHQMGGRWQEMLESAHITMRVAQQAGNHVYLFMGSVLQSWAEERLGQFAAAGASIARCQEIAQSLGQQLVLADWLAAIRAEVALGQGRIEESLTTAEQTVGVAKSMGALLSAGLAQRAWGRALAAQIQREPARAPRWDAVDEHMAASVEAFEAGMATVEAARTHVAWGIICRERNDLSGAREHFAQAAARFEASGLVEELERTRGLIAGVK